MSETPEQFAARRRAEYVAALKDERDGYARVGQTDRAKIVDEEIRRTEKPEGAKPKPKRDTAENKPRAER